MLHIEIKKIPSVQAIFSPFLITFNHESYTELFSGSCNTTRFKQFKTLTFFYNCHNVAFRDRYTFCNTNFLHNPITGCTYRNFHFHGFQYQQIIILFHRLSNLCNDFPNCTGCFAFNILNTHCIPQTNLVD